MMNAPALALAAPLDRARALLRADPAVQRRDLPGLLCELEAAFAALDHRATALEDARDLAGAHGAVGVVDALAALIVPTASARADCDALFSACTTCLDRVAATAADVARDRRALALAHETAATAIATLPAAIRGLRATLDKVAAADRLARTYADTHGDLPPLAPRASVESVALSILAALFAPPARAPHELARA